MSAISEKDEFNLYYSFHLENIYETLNRRLANLLYLIQFILGSAVFANYHGWIIGLTLTIITAVQYIYKPSENALNARKKKNKYRKLINSLELIDTAILLKEKLKLENNDSSELRSVFKLAALRAAIETDRQEVEKLNYFEKLIAFCAGGIQR